MGLQEDARDAFGDQIREILAAACALFRGRHNMKTVAAFSTDGRPVLVATKGPGAVLREGQEPEPKP
ncbi:MAG: hypothetical protein M3P26_04265 [Gemmatimonadota bacterium]|nr:hypothetical protein [Gemmatimonadota bacterium]